MAGRKPIGMVGQRFGRLKVVGRSYLKARHAVWFCRCDCGEYRHVERTDLTGQRTISCGCVRKVRFSAANRPQQSP